MQSGFWSEQDARAHAKSLRILLLGLMNVEDLRAHLLGTFSPDVDERKAVRFGTRIPSILNDNVRLEPNRQVSLLMSPRAKN